MKTITFEENEILELKKSTSELKEAICSIVAIINKHGSGDLYFGIKNDGEVIGQTVNDKTLRDISEAISNHIEPKIFPVIDRVVIENKTCIYVRFDGAEIPYYAYGRAYIRVSDADKKISAKELERIIIEKNKNLLVWDKEVSEKKVNDIDAQNIIQFIKSANSASRINFEFTDIKTTLKKLNLIANNDKILNAGDLLFASNPSLEVQMATFAGVEKLTFIDIKREEGTILQLLEKMEEYVKQRINWGVKFGALERVEEPEIPIKALREALVNSLCHRDYRNPKPNEVAVFKNRIEIYNPGKFPDGLTPKLYIKGNERSILRNPLIAKMLYYCKEIEEWGSGFKRIYNECFDNNVKVEFSILKTGFLTTFYRHEKVGVKSEKVGVKSEKVGVKSEKVGVKSEKLGFKSEKLGFKSEKLGFKSEKLGDKTTSKIINLIKKDINITQPMMAKTLNLSLKGIEWQIKKLVTNNIIKRVGSRKTGHWEIIE